MRKFNDREKEIIRSLVHYNFNQNTMSVFLKEKYFTKEKGVVFLLETKSNMNILLYSIKEYSNDQSRNECIMEFVELINLLEFLYENKFIRSLPNEPIPILIISTLVQQITINNNRILINNSGDYIDTTDVNMYEKNKTLKYKHVAFNNLQINFNNLFNAIAYITEDLKQLVANDFKTDEQIRYEKQLEEARNQTKGAYIAAFVSFLGLLVALVLPFCTKTELAEKDDIIKAINDKKIAIPAVIDTKITNDTIKVDVANKTIPTKITNEIIKVDVTNKVISTKTQGNL